MTRAITAADLGIPETFNVASHFLDRHTDEGRATKIAIECGDEQVTYAELGERVNRFGRALRDILEVRPEERVMLLLLDTPAFAVAFFGAIKIGAVPIPTNTLWKTADYRHVLNDARARVVIISDELLPRIEAIDRADVPALEHVVVVGQTPTAGAHRSFADLLDRGSPELTADRTQRDSPAFWLYSSGSTGAPKGCVHLHHDMAICAELFAKGVLGIRPGDRCFSVAKLFFAYGLGNAMTFPLTVGATTVLNADRPTPDGVAALLRKHPITVFFAVPTFYAAFLASPNAPKKSEVKLRRCISAGEALPEEIALRWNERYGVEISDGLGTTEMLHIYLTNAPGATKYGTTGKPVPGYEIKLVGDDGSPVKKGEMGELYVRGPTSAIMYWNNREKSRSTFQGEWTRSGDKYIEDADGYYVCCGRQDDMLKVSGMYVSPFEVEAALSSHPDVLEAAVVGWNDEQKLIKPKAFVVLKSPEKANDALVRALQEHVKQKLAPYKYPRWIEFRKDLPKTATGKIQRFKLRAEGPGAL